MATHRGLCPAEEPAKPPADSLWRANGRSQHRLHVEVVLQLPPFRACHKGHSDVGLLEEGHSEVDLGFVHVTTANADSEAVVGQSLWGR